MKKAVKYKKLWLVINILLSALTVVGIPMIPLGFVTRVYTVGILGIIFVAHGFFGLTFYWQWFAKIVRGVKVVTAFERDRLTRAEDIALATGISLEEVNRLIRWAMEREWIVGRLFYSGEIIKNPNLKGDGVVECEYCGAKINTESGDVRCEGCGAPVKNNVQKAIQKEN